jgi:TctA family transporter
MGLFDFIGPASGLLFTLENIIWINLGVFIGCVFAAIPGLSVILCIILFLPVTYTMKAIPGMMFLLGIYCAGGYGGVGYPHQHPGHAPRGGYYAGRSSTVQDGPHQGGS